jgi:filamentous hemagglutinin family protein
MFWRLQKILLATTALVPLAAAPVDANPLGAQVVAGSASVQGQGTPTVTVTQQSNRAIINWNTFNIGAGETTKIVQPSSSSVELDRVTGGLGPSQIFGSLFSNGQVFVVNPDGILVGPGGKIDTATFLATTHDIANRDFMAGNYNFTGPGNPAASIVNEGSITAQNGGFAALVAPGVRNTGTITATLGQIGLTSANEFSLDFYGDSLITLGVNDSIAATVMDVATGQPLSSLVTNTGKLKANGGTVELTAVAARQVVDSVINNTGVIEANSVGTHNGMIVLGAATGANAPAGAPTQTVKVSGKLSAAGKKRGTTGGTIVVTGENIQVSGAKISTSGRNGGGTVLIGGDTGGGNPSALSASIAGAALEPFSVPTATTVSVDASSVINASATGQGNGGKVVVWADQATTFYGTILATGGASGGNGGFVETSSHQVLTYNGTVNTSAPLGQVGTALLDPGSVSIDANPGTGIITVGSIESGLLSENFIVTTGAGSGDITVDSDVNLTWANAGTLTLNAFGNIDFQAGALISNTGAGNLILRADNTGAGTGTVSFGSTDQIDFSGSTGTVSIYYNPADNPAGSIVNNTSYISATNYAPYVLTNGAVSNQLTAYMLVNTVYDLQNIENNLAGDYALGTNIDASATASWNGGAGFVPIGSSVPGFTGIFDGQGDTIEGLTINTPSASYVGLFGIAGLNNNGIQPSVIRNVGLIGGSVSGDFDVGSLVGLNYGTVANSYSSASVFGDSGSGNIGGLVGINGSGSPVSSSGGTISSSYSTGIVSANSGSYDIGGLVGENYATISQSYARGNVLGTQYVGGLVGFNFVGNLTLPAGITQSYASGTVTGSDSVGGLVGQSSGPIVQSYATGNVSGSSNVGGLVGMNYSYQFGGLIKTYYFAVIDQSYSTGAVAGSSNVGGLVGSNPQSVGELYASDIFKPPYIGGLLGSNFANFYDSYWDKNTSGQATSAQDLGFVISSATGLTTAQFESGLPNGFDPTVWGSNPGINNGYPYLLWQFPNGVPGGGGGSNTSSTPILPPGVAPFSNLQTAFFNSATNTQNGASTQPINITDFLGLNSNLNPPINWQIAPAGTFSTPLTTGEEIFYSTAFFALLPVVCPGCGLGELGFWLINFDSEIIQVDVNLARGKTEQAWHDFIVDVSSEAIGLALP